MRLVLVQVANEAAVLSAVRRYAQLLKPGILRDLAMDMVRPRSALPEEMLGHLHRLATHRRALLMSLVVSSVLFAFSTCSCNGQRCVLQTGHMPSCCG